MSLPSLPIDRYDYEAGILPALIVLASPILASYAWFPKAYKIGYGLAPLIFTLGIVIWLAQLARDTGKRKEQTLFLRWGGKPTTVLLRYADSTLDPSTKARYRDFLLRNVPLLVLPSHNEELADPIAADGAYDSGVKWLLARTRDQKLLLTQNIHYGFRRNLWAMRPIGASLTAVAAIAGLTEIGVIWRRSGVLDTTSLSITSILMLLAVMWIGVNPSWVRRAGYSYAAELLSACDRLRPDKSSPQEQKKKVTKKIK